MTEASIMTSMRVLLVEDDEQMADTVRRGLASENQDDRGDDPGLELGLALRPKHREEAKQRLEAPLRLFLLLCRVRHRSLR